MNLLFLNRKPLLLCILLIISTNSLLFSQGSDFAEERPFLEQVRFGGSLGLSLRNGFFNASIAPKAVYDFNSYSSAGIGLLGSYTNASNYEAFTYGGSILGLLRPIRGLQLSAEFEELKVNRNLNFEGANRKTSYWYPALFLGAGFTTGPMTVGIRYDVLFQDNKSIYGNALMPFVSVYF